MTCSKITPDRVYAQYRASKTPKINKWLSINQELACELAEAIERASSSYDIESATTYELDAIGALVGETRALLTGLGLTQDEENDLYRLFIRAKIAKNSNVVSSDDMFAAITTVLPDLDIVKMVDVGDMSYSIEIDGELTDLERFMLVNVDIFPRPAGVRFFGFLEVIDYVQVGDDTAECNPDGQYECVSFIAPSKRGRR